VEALVAIATCLGLSPAFAWQQDVVGNGEGDGFGAALALDPAGDVFAAGRVSLKFPGQSLRRDAFTVTTACSSEPGTSPAASPSTRRAT
jgi:hypothetical protein